MTAALFNNQNGNFGNVIDAFVYPQFIGYALRAPTTHDVYPPGTRWQNNAVNPAVQFYTTGAGLWYELPNTSFGVSSVTGTANQITASPTVGAVILSIPTTFIAPGSIASTTTMTAGTGITATTGNITASAGNIVATLGNITATAGSVSAGTTVTAGTGITATTGNIVASAGNMSASGTVTGGTGVIATTGNVTATAGNLVATAGNLDLNGATSKVVINASAPSTASIGTTAAMTAGTITVSTTAVTASSKIFLSANTPGGTQGVLSVGTIVAGTSFVINSSNNADTSTVNYWIVN